MGSQREQTTTFVVGGSMNPQNSTVKKKAAAVAEKAARRPARQAPTTLPVMGSRDTHRGGVKYAADGHRGQFAPASGAPDLDTWSVAAAVDYVTTQMRALAMDGHGSPATVDKYIEVLGRFVAFAQAHGVTRLVDVDETLVRGFTVAPLPSGRGRSPIDVGKAPATGTTALRRAAVAALFRGMRAGGLADLDPVSGVPVGTQRRTRLRPATPEQVSQICGHAESYGASTYGAGLIALMLSGASTAEGAYVSVKDVNLDAGTVRLPGMPGRIRERVIAVGPWEHRILSARVDALTAEFRAAKNLDALADWPVAFRRPASQFKYGHVSQNAGGFVRKVITQSGLNVATTGLTPMSLTQYAVNRVYALTGSVEQVAAMYGIKDLNAARALISDEWQEKYALPESIPSVAGGLDPRPLAVGGAA